MTTCLTKAPMESEETTNKPGYTRNPEWTVRALDWLLYRSHWWKVGLAVTVGALVLLVNLALIFTNKAEAWGFWANLFANAMVPALAMGLLFYIVLSGITRMIGHRIIAYVPGPDALRKLSPSDLEHLTGEVYRMQGHQVKRRGVPGQPDKGIDLEIRRNGQNGIIQCKKWTHEYIGVDKLRELHGAMVDASAEFAIFVTTSDFTEPAEAYASDKRIELVNLGKLWEMVADAKLEAEAKKLTDIPAKLKVKDRQHLTCPQCGNSLVLRKSRHGEFLGCKSWHETGCAILVPVKRG